MKTYQKIIAGTLLFFNLSCQHDKKIGIDYIKSDNKFLYSEKWEIYTDKRTNLIKEYADKERDGTLDHLIIGTYPNDTSFTIEEDHNLALDEIIIVASVRHLRRNSEKAKKFQGEFDELKKIYSEND